MCGQILGSLHDHAHQVQRGVHHLRGEVQLRAQAHLRGLQPRLGSPAPAPAQLPASVVTSAAAAAAPHGLDVEGLGAGPGLAALLLPTQVQTQPATVHTQFRLDSRRETQQLEISVSLKLFSFVSDEKCFLLMVEMFSLVTKLAQLLPPAALLDVAGVQAGGGGGGGLLLVPPAQRLLQELGHVPAANLGTEEKVNEQRTSLQCWSS